MTEWIIGAAIVVLVLRRPGETSHEGPDAERSSPMTRATTADRVRHVVSAAVRLAFLGWLYEVTDGAAFSPFSFAGDAGQPLQTAVGLAETAIGVVAVAHRWRARHNAVATAGTIDR